MSAAETYYALVMAGFAGYVAAAGWSWHGVLYGIASGAVCAAGWLVADLTIAGYRKARA